MALYVNTNVSSLNAQRKLANSTNALNVSYQRLASGLRINSAKDDAAGLAVSDRLTSQINGLEQGNRNANDGIALLQTIEGALDETTNMLQRIRTLAVQAANGTYTQEDRDAMQKEVTQLSLEITRIGRKTTFAGAQVLDGTDVLKKSLLGDDGSIDFQVGANHNDTYSLNLKYGFTMSGCVIAHNLEYNEGFTDTWVVAAVGDKPTAGLVYDATQGIRWSVSDADAAQATLKTIDGAIYYIDDTRAMLGALQNRMEATIRNQSSIAENESDARSRIRDTDFASETATLTQNNIIQQASQSVLAQANQRPTLAVNLLGGI